MDLSVLVNVVEKQLHPDMRYKCLLIQTNNPSFFSPICEFVAKGFNNLGSKVDVLDSNQMQDDVGAYSSSKVISDLMKASINIPLILSGPLHFLDYWTERQIYYFWGSLASLESSRGLVLVDVIRIGEVQGIFNVVGRIHGTDVRFLKSRRALMEAH